MGTLLVSGSSPTDAEYTDPSADSGNPLGIDRHPPDSTLFRSNGYTIDAASTGKEAGVTISGPGTAKATFVFSEELLQATGEGTETPDGPVEFNLNDSTVLRLEQAGDGGMHGMVYNKFGNYFNTFDIDKAGQVTHGTPTVGFDDAKPPAERAGDAPSTTYNSSADNQTFNADSGARQRLFAEHAVEDRAQAEAERKAAEESAQTTPPVNPLPPTNAGGHAPGSDHGSDPVPPVTPPVGGSQAPGSPNGPEPTDPAEPTTPTGDPASPPGKPADPADSWRDALKAAIAARRAAIEEWVETHRPPQPGEPASP